MKPVIHCGKRIIRFLASDVLKAMPILRQRAKLSERRALKRALHAGLQEAA